MNKYILILPVLFTFFVSIGQDTYTVMTYNLLNFPRPTNVDPLGDDAARVVYFREIVESTGADIIIVQELADVAGADLLLTELNTNTTLGKTYGRAPIYTSYVGLGNMLFYNSSIFTFVSQAEVPRINMALAPDNTPVITPRAYSHYVLDAHPVNCPSQTTRINVFSSHLKAGTDEASGSQISDRDRRVLGAADLIDYFATLPANANIILGGDMNFYSHLANNIASPVHSEPAYDSLMTNFSTHPLNDPIGGWTRNIAGDADKYTQSTRVVNNAVGNNGAGGGLDDRFDFWFHNDNVATGTNNVQYVAGSYQPLGSSNMLNTAVTAGTSPIATQLHNMSDHLPVIMDLEFTYPPELACDCESILPPCQVFPWTGSN